MSSRWCLENRQGSVSRQGAKDPLETVYPLREPLNSVQRMVSGGYCEGLFPDTVCWTQLRNTWPLGAKNAHCLGIILEYVAGVFRLRGGEGGKGGLERGWGRVGEGRVGEGLAFYTSKHHLKNSSNVP